MIFLKSFKCSRPLIGLSCLTLFFLSVIFFYDPALSSDNYIIADISTVKPFTAETDYMSVEGYIISRVRIDYGRDISRGEARRIIKNSIKNTAKKPAGAKIITFAGSGEAQNKSVLADPISKYRKIIQNGGNDDRLYRKVSLDGTGSQNNTVLLVPFNDLTNKKTEALDNVAYFVEKYFKNKNLKVVRLNIGGDGSGGLNMKDYAGIARKHNARYIVGGEIGRFERYKKISAAGVLIDLPFFGVHNYADVTLSSHIFDASKNSIIFENLVRRNKKRQVFGIFRGNSGLMSYTVKEAVDGLYQNMKL